MDRGVWQAIVHGVAKSQTQLSTHTHTLGLLTSQEPRCLQLENDQPSNPQDFSKLKESGTSDTTDQGTFVETNTCDW